MSDRIRQGLAYLIAMAMVLAVAAAPTVAQTTDENAERLFEAAGVSVDKVDGLDATKYTTNKVKRAGKIVATNANGVLPSNIVKPQWRVIQNMPNGFADGYDDVGYESWVYPDTFSVGDTAKSIALSSLHFEDMDYQILPINVGDEVIVIEETFKRAPIGSIARYLRVKRHSASPSANVQFKVRLRIFDFGIEPASKAALRDMVTVKVVKRR